MTPKTKNEKQENKFKDKRTYRLFNLPSINDLQKGEARIAAADYTIPVKLDDGMVYIAQFDADPEQEKEKDKFKIEPKVYSLIPTQTGVKAIEEELSLSAKFLDSAEVAVIIERCADLFFDNLKVYEELGYLKKRGILLHSQPGVGKSSNISRVCKRYSATKEAAVLIWPSDKIEASTVKYFLSKGVDWKKVKKLILVIEDIGGGDVPGGRGQMSVSSDMLNFLDGIEVVFEVPTFIIATTNNPDAQLNSLTARPGRFDEVIQLKNPDATERAKFYSFFCGEEAWNSINDAMKTEIVKKADGFATAHIKEVYIRARLNDAHWIGNFGEKLLKSTIQIKDWMDQQKKGRLSATHDNTAGFGGFR